MTPKLPLSDRIEKVSKLLSVSAETLSKSLEEAGIKNDPAGLALLDAETTTSEDLVEILQSCVPSAKKLQLKACAGTLKGYDPLSKNERIQYTSNTAPQTRDETVIEAVKALRPIQQWSDEEVLEKFSKTRDYECEQELNRRAKGQNFIVLIPGKYEPGKEVIDTKMSLELLRNTRKRTNPSTLPVEGTVLQVYKVTELNLEERIVEICPICGKTMYKGWCENCQVNISGVGDDERAFMKLVADSDNFSSDSMSDRKALVISAMKGIDDLKVTWPSLVKEFDELKATGNLPKLKIIGNRPSTADPFFQDGNRSFGNRSY
jgi:hypothetical protein